MVFRGLAVYLVALVAVACGKASESVDQAQVVAAVSAANHDGGKIKLPPATLQNPSKTTRIVLEDSDIVANAPNTGSLEIVLNEGLALRPSNQNLILRVEHVAYMQDGVSKHGNRNYSDNTLPKLLRERAYAEVTYRPFDSEKQRRELSWKMTTPVLEDRLRAEDVSRVLKKKTRVLFELQSTEFDENTDLHTAKYVAWTRNGVIVGFKFVSKSGTVGELRRALGTREIYGVQAAD